MKNTFKKILLEFNQYIKSIKIKETNVDYVFNLFVEYIINENNNDFKNQNSIQIKKISKDFAETLDITFSELFQIYYCGDCGCYFLPFIDDSHLTIEDTETNNVCGNCAINYKQCNCSLFIKKENKCFNCD